MTAPPVHQLARTQLAHAREYPLVVVGHQVEHGNEVQHKLDNSAETLAFLGKLVPDREPIAGWLTLEADGYQPREAPIEWPPSEFKFAIAPDGLAAAAILALDQHGDTHQWVSTGHEPTELALPQDPWNPVNTFPSSATMPTAELRHAAVAWAFGDLLPPPASDWREADERDITWN